MHSTKTPEQRQRMLDEPHKKACMYAARLVSGFVETRDEAVRKPLTAMSRRLFEEIMGIRKRNPDTATVESQSKKITLETILEAEIDAKLDVEAQAFLGKLSITPPETFDYTEHGHGLTSTTYELHERLGGLRVERLAEEGRPLAQYQLHSPDLHAAPGEI